VKAKNSPIGRKQALRRMAPAGKFVKGREKNPEGGRKTKQEDSRRASLGRVGALLSEGKDGRAKRKASRKKKI